MKTLFVSVIISIILGFNSYSQTSNDIANYRKYEEKYLKYFEYTDKNFPQDNNSAINEKDMIVYKNALEEYAKLHPALPKKTITGNVELDDINNQVLIDNWYANNPFFPRFIPYHKFHKNLSLQDDIQNYEDAVKVWMGKNDKIVKEIKN